MSLILNTENTDKRISNRKYYLVDFDSVKANGLDGLENLNADDNMIVFFVKGESTVDFSVIAKFNSCCAGVIMKEIERKVLLPFVISMYIGSIINENPEIYLICKSGESYIKAAEIATGREINITIQQSISGVEVPPPVFSSMEDINESASPEAKIINILSHYDLSSSETAYILKLINDACEKYPNSRACRLPYVRDNIRRNIYPADENIFIAIEPYI